MDSLKLTFADGTLGDILDSLFAAGDGLDLETNGRIASVCRLLEQLRSSDGAHDMVHAELDTLETIAVLTPIAARLRKQLVRRKTPPGTYAPRRYSAAWPLQLFVMPPSAADALPRPLKMTGVSGCTGLCREIKPHHESLWKSLGHQMRRLDR